jgi:hypothetical protein
MDEEKTMADSMDEENAKRRQELLKIVQEVEDVILVLSLIKQENTNQQRVYRQALGGRQRVRR